MPEPEGLQKQAADESPVWPDGVKGDPIPTNLITGFLGVGKTTAILHLLAHKPADERWAVLINEFGEIGIDGSLVAGLQAQERGIHISEVPGGCMCCTAGLPMQVALNLLVSEAKPHRILIEPTGLGHPLEVLEALSAPTYQEILKLQRTLTLVDARKLSDDRYTGNPTFQQQLEVADLVVANKEDLYSGEDRDNLDGMLRFYCGPDTELLVTSHGKFGPERLEGPARTRFQPGHAHHADADTTLAGDLPFPDSGYVMAVNQGEGFESVGWRFRPDLVFDRRRLFAFLTGLRVERLKAVFITTDGIFAYNMTRDALQEISLDDCMESRVEMIADSVDRQWEETLLGCLDRA